jgi:hypothetical protein
MIYFIIFIPRVEKPNFTRVPWAEVLARCEQIDKDTCNQQVAISTTDHLGPEKFSQRSDLQLAV